MIRRLIQLVLDKSAAKRVEDETKKSLDKGTDPRKPEQNLGRIGRAMEGLKSLALRLGGVLAAAFGVRAIVRFGKEAVRVATESAAIWNRLAGQLSVAGVEFRDVEGEIRSTARALQDVTKVGDEDFAAIMTELLGTTNDYAASLREVETVANLAAAKQIDLRTAAQLVGRAMVGQTGTLSRYGIIVEEGADAMEVLRARFAGMARNEARELEGRVAMLGNEWADLKQAIGDAMIEAGGGTSVIDTLIGTVKGLTNWVNENRLAIAAWGNVVIRTARAIVETFRFMGRMVVNAFEIVGAHLANVWLETSEGFARFVNFVLDGIDKIPGVDLEFRMNQLTPEEFAEQQRLLYEDMAGEAGDMVDALFDLGQAYRDVGTAAVEAAAGQREAASVPPPRPPVQPTAGGDEDEVDEGRFRRLLEVTAAANEAARAYREEELEALQEKAAEVGENMTAAFEGFFSAAATGFEAQGGIFGSAVEAARGAGAAIISAFTEGQAEKEMAMGTAAIAAGLWPPNPAAIASGLKHFAAAALFRAIPGVVAGGGGGAPSVGGGGAAALPRGAVGTSIPSSGDVAGAEVHIYIDPLNPSDPVAQRFVLGAHQQAVDRFGPNVRLQVHSRTGR